MIADCETCDRKQVPCGRCETSQRLVCFVCQGDECDPYGELPPAETRRCSCGAKTKGSCSDCAKIEHTPLPWRYQEGADRYTHIVRSGERFITQLSQDTSGRSEADARLIVAAVNSHEARAKIARSPALDEIAAERQRQIIKGYDAAHDDAHSDGSIARAAAVYALLSVPNLLSTMAFWPWSPAQCRPGSKRERLVKAAALCVAEIERLDRLTKESL